MPVTKQSDKLIPKIYRRNYDDIGLYFFVMGQRSIMPAVSIEKAVINYFRFIKEEDYNIESSMSTFVRLQNEFYESTKTNKI